MKKIFIAILSILMVSAVDAQDAKKLLKQASKDFATYNKDTNGNKDYLKSALEAVEQAFALPGTAEDGNAWVTKGEIFSGLADAEMKQKLINPDYVVENRGAATIALEAFTKVLAITESKTNKKDALSGLKEVEAHLNNMGITDFQAANYAEAFTNFNGAIKAYNLLKDNGESSRLDDETVRNDHFFYTAVSGYYGDKGEESLPILHKLYEVGSEEPLVYEALFNLESPKKGEAAMKYLDEGRKKFPDNTALLFAEINHYLGKGELDKLTDKLKAAIEAEPDNISVINTTGNVYEQLYNREKEAGNEDKANEYFDIAKDYYTQALNKDVDNFDSNYSLGALYYNQAAGMTAIINELANDYSTEGTKKYDEATAKMNALFDKGLPFFEKANLIKADDINTMIALKEIYVRKGNLEKANEIKAKLGQ